MAFRIQTSSSRPAVSARAHARLPSGTSRVALSAAIFGGATRATVPASLSFSSQREQRRDLGSKQVVAATSEANFDEGIAGTNDYSPLLAVVGFVAVWFNKLHVDRYKLLQGLAALQLFVTAVNLVTRRGVGDKISNVVGPAVLAAAVLNIRHVTYLDTATALFGYFLSENLETITGLPYYAYLATLAVALYLGYGTLWYVVAFGVAAAGKVYNSTKNSDPLPVVVLPALAAAGFAVWKEATVPLALSIYLAQTAWSVFGAVDTLSKSAKD